MDYEQVYFAQGSDAHLPLEILGNEGPDRAIEYLKQWHYPGEHEVREESSAGNADFHHETPDGYLLSANNALEYIGLEFMS